MMTTAANPLSIYDRPLKARFTRWEVETAALALPSLGRTLGHFLLCHDLQLGIAEHRSLSGVQLIRARHAYPLFDWQWVD
jgi:hypothetical protein